MSIDLEAGPSDRWVPQRPVPLVEVRRAAGSDAHALAVLGAQTFLDSHIDQADPRDLDDYVSRHFDLDRIGAKLSKPAVAYLLAFRDGGDWPSGYAELSTMAGLGDRKDVELERIYVTEPDIGIGVGGALMRSALLDHMRSGCTSMSLAVDHHNVRAMGFYRRFGFAVAGDRDFRIGQTVRRQLVMQRSLDYEMPSPERTYGPRGRPAVPVG